MEPCVIIIRCSDSDVQTDGNNLIAMHHQLAGLCDISISEVRSATTKVYFQCAIDHQMQMLSSGSTCNISLTKVSRIDVKL